MDFYGPKLKTYSGSAPYPGLDVFEVGTYTASSLGCADVQTAVTDFGTYFGYYPVECDFVTLDGTGTVFMMNPGDMVVKNSIEVTTSLQLGGEYISYENMKTIIFVEVGFIIVAIFVNFLARQFQKFKR